jgi:protein ImuB
LWLLEAPRPVQTGQGLLQQLGCRERICSGWWDDHPVRRDYYQDTTSVTKTWIFRDLNSGRWHLHGIF